MAYPVLPDRTAEDIKREHDALVEENRIIRKIIKAQEDAKKPRIAWKVSEKGAVSVYFAGLKYPITLYADKMEMLLDHADDLRNFIHAQAENLRRPEQFDAEAEFERLRRDEGPVGQLIREKLA